MISYYNDSNAKEQHESLGIEPYRYPRTRTILLERFSSTPMVMLSAKRHFVSIELRTLATFKLHLQQK